MSTDDDAPVVCRECGAPEYEDGLCLTCSPCQGVHWCPYEAVALVETFNDFSESRQTPMCRNCKERYAHLVATEQI